MQLREMLIAEIFRLADAKPDTDQYGYRSAMKKVVDWMSEENYLRAEKQQIINACEAAPKPSTWNADYKTFGEQYYNEKFNQI